MQKSRVSILSLALLSAALVLPGCGKEEHKKAATQVVAKVNGEEISVHQINFVLARAYLEKIAAAQPKPTTDEARKYYAEHPELFAQRRVYNLQEILVPADLLAEIQKLVGQNKSMQEIAANLKSRDLKFAANAGVRAAEQLPLPIAAKLHGIKDGQTVVLEAPQGAMAVHVVASQSQPVPESDALPRIQQFLANQRNSEAVANELKAMRAKAKIEQTGDIAIAPAGAAPAAAQPAAVPPKADAAPATPAAPAAINESSVAKGVAGLK